jgi:hypothetical protein
MGGNSLKKEVEMLKERNRRVEADKAWEVSIARRIIISALTYFVIVVFFYSINAQRPWINAIVPSIGFIISTLTLGFFKRIWLKYHYRK